MGDRAAGAREKAAWIWLGRLCCEVLEPFADPQAGGLVAEMLGAASPGRQGKWRPLQGAGGSAARAAPSFCSRTAKASMLDAKYCLEWA